MFLYALQWFRCGIRFGMTNCSTCNGAVALPELQQTFLGQMQTTSIVRPVAGDGKIIP